MSERKLKAWQDAGLIDAETATRIRNWEAQHSRPLGLWALIGIAALAIGLGLISIIAANWDAIAGEVRLGIHFAAMAGLAAFLWVRPPAHEALKEALLFVLAALGLTFFGHLGQVYQTGSPLWQPLGLWLLLFTPLLLGWGRSWLSALGWFAGLSATLLLFVSHLADRGKDMPDTFLLGLIAAIPALVVPMAAWLRGRSTRPDFWRRLEQIALTYAVFGASQLLIVTAFGNGGDRGDIVKAVLAMSLVSVVAAGLQWVARPTPSGRSVAMILALAAGLTAFGLAVMGVDLAAAILFMLFWTGIAVASLRAGWRAVFQAATAVIALRLIVLSFELASDLLGSGVGLVLAGLFTLGVAWAAVRVSKRYAPKEDEA